MQHDTPASIIYLLTSGVGFLFVASLYSTSSWLEFVISCLCVSVPPLLFVFAYARSLVVGRAPRRWATWELVIIGAASAGAIFLVFSPFGKTAIRDLGESWIFLFVLLAVLVIFLVAAISLLLRNKSELTSVTSVLIGPYWLMLALTFEGRWYQDRGAHTVFYFLCFLTPIFFAFAAGAISRSPTLAHVTASFGILAVPSLYWNLTDHGLGNAWLIFNQPDNGFAVYPPSVVLGICFVPLVALATFTAILRLLPDLWPSGKLPISGRMWPAIVVSLGVMIVWFCESVVPYRIAGAVDYARWPVLQILHVQKRGLQFHETCVSVSGYRMKNDYWGLQTVSFSGNNRRLLQYRFEEARSSGELPESLRGRVTMVLTDLSQRHAAWGPVTPVRSWNADNWYVISEGAGLKSYTAESGFPAPHEIVDLFNDLEQLPHFPESESELKDVCLGFCYDPLSAMGYLYENQRCFNSGHGTVCR